MRARRAAAAAGSIPPLPHGEQDAHRWFLKVVTVSQLWGRQDGAALVAILVDAPPSPALRRAGAAGPRRRRGARRSRQAPAPGRPRAWAFQLMSARCASTNGTVFAPSNRRTARTMATLAGRALGLASTAPATSQARSRHADHRRPLGADHLEPGRDAGAAEDRAALPRARGGRRRSRHCSVCRSACPPRRHAGSPRSSCCSARTARPTSTPRGTTTPRSLGEKAQTIDELPLEWFFAPGVRLDFTTKEDGDAVTARGDRLCARRTWTATSSQHDIVLIRTGRDTFLDAPRLHYQCSAADRRGAATCLYEMGVRARRAPTPGPGRRAALHIAGRGGDPVATSRASSARPPVRPALTARSTSASATSARSPRAASGSRASALKVVGGSAGPGARRSDPRRVALRRLVARGDLLGG